jgi:hypothetical protein
MPLSCAQSIFPNPSATILFVIEEPIALKFTIFVVIHAIIAFWGVQDMFDS